MSGFQTPLAQDRCQPIAAGTPTLATSEIDDLMAQLGGWEVGSGRLGKTFAFPDHYATLAFINAVAWVSHRQDHHPDLSVGYNRCRVEYFTHTVGGLSRNDFVCAAKIDVLMVI